MLKKIFSTDINEFISKDLALLMLRIGAGALIFTHGLPKLMRILDGNMQFADPIGLGPEVSLVLAAIGEGILGLFLILGLATRLSALYLAFVMATAFFFYHADDPFSSKEKSLLFMIMFFVILFTGPGKYSLDRPIERKLNLS